MNQQELEAWIAQNGGAEGVRFRTKSINVKNPAKAAFLADGTTVNPDYDTDAPDTITVQVLSWTNPTTGATIAVRPSGADQYEVMDTDTGEPAAAKDPGAAAADANAVELQKQRERNAALPEAQDPAYETDAERRARGRQTALDQEGAAARAKATADADAAKAKAEADKTKAEGIAAEQRNRPAISYKKVGQKTYKVLTYPDGREEVSESAIPPDVADQQVTTIDGQPARVVRDAEGRVTGIEIVPVTGGGTDPTFVGSLPTYIPETVRTDLEGYSKELAAAVKAGSITPARATALMDARLKSAQSAVDSELDAAKKIYDSGVTQRGQDITQANAGLSASSANYGKALDTATGVNDWVNPGSDAGYRLFQSLLREGLKQAQAYGGLDKPGDVPIPAALQRQANITVQAPDGTVVTVPSGASQPPSPGLTPQQLQDSIQRPPVVDPNQQASYLLNPQPTGIASLDQQGQRQGQRPRVTFESMENKFRELGMDEDAIQESRSHYMGAGVA